MEPVPGEDKLNELMARVNKAQEAYKGLNQATIDSIFKAVSIAAGNERIKLAEMAVAETGIGIVEDKVIKNHYASEIIYNKVGAVS
ncbi:hypothetical protein KIPB_005415 [Kipferlia bialata]|uniref:Aldehyde dehydrogenase domain-containing protein n=1 Tax=Kipferlia bialata TaxID=797122 RepID=A0A391NLG5_9EUKA|nr:hypothetical protein KIPB_005415 [Kipferlia bialata]|eukprot:g5415.t1